MSRLIRSPLTHSPLIHGGGVRKPAGGATPFTTEWKSAGAGADVNVRENDFEHWNDPGNITASDDTRAASDSGSFSAGVTNILRATDFGFTTGDIPSGATILGIEVGIERRNGGASSPADETVILRTSGGQTGDNKADTGTTWPSSEAEATYGGSSDDWNAGLSDSDIRGSDFGVDLEVAYSDTYGGGVEVDHIRVRVHGEA